jgi:hypothetical protein
MRVAVAFLPLHINELMNLLAKSELYRTSGFKVASLAVRFLAMAVPRSGQFQINFSPRDRK